MTAPFSRLLQNPPATQAVATEIHVFDELDSTNAFALASGTPGMAVIADRQTAGRGRRGNTWDSRPGLGIWMTCVLDGVPSGLTFAAALSVRDAIGPVAPAQIKWPNDVLCNGKKICGILVETRADITALGIGVNVLHEPDDFPEALQTKAGSLASQTGRHWSRDDVAHAILTHLDQRVMLLRNGGLDQVRADWAQACNLVGRTIRVDGRLTGTVKDIDDAGALLLETSSGLERILTGAVTYPDGD